MIKKLLILLAIILIFKAQPPSYHTGEAAFGVGINYGSDEGFDDDSEAGEVIHVVEEITYNNVYTNQVVVDDKTYDYDSNDKQQTTQTYDNMDGILEFSISCWIKLNPAINRPQWATGYHFNGNKWPQDFQNPGDRTLAFFVINNILHFPTYDLNTKNNNLYQNIEFNADNEGKWAYVYHAYSPDLQKAYVWVLFNNQQPKALHFLKVAHQSSSNYSLFVGQSFQYRNFPGRIQNLRLCAGAKCYKEGDDLNKVVSQIPPKETVIPQQNVPVVDVKDWDSDDDNKAPVYQKFENKFNGVQEFSISGWYKLSRGANRSAWSTGYHFNCNQNPQDLSQPGDRTLAFFVINNILHFPTYDIRTGNNNLNQNVDFTQDNEGVWLLIYHAYSDSVQKAYVYTQFAKQEAKVLHFNNVVHRASTIYHLYVGQSFSYRNFPGRIQGLSLCGGNGCYYEIGIENSWKGAPVDVPVPKQDNQVVNEKDWDYNGSIDPVYTKFDNKFTGVQEFSIQCWIRLNPNVQRPAWATGYHFNSNIQPQDLQKPGDRTLAFFVINNVLHFPTYDLKSGNNNLYQNVEFSNDDLGVWALVYHAYSDQVLKAYVLTQFSQKNPAVLHYNNVVHKDASVYHLWVGQSFGYKNFPGRINNLRLCAGRGCYREQGFEQDWQKVPAVVPVPNVNKVVVNNNEWDYNGAANQVYQKYENQFNGILEFSIQAWMKLTPGVARPAWATVYHFNQNQNPQDCAVHGDRNLALFIINNGLYYTTYDLNTNNINTYQQINFTEGQTGVWALIYQAFSDKLSKGYVYQQFFGSNFNELKWSNIKHKESNIYHLYVGQSFGYKNFPGRINNLRLCGGLGCYREIGFEKEIQLNPGNVVIPKQELKVVENNQWDYNGATSPVYQKYDSQFNDVLEFSITAWIRLIPGVPRPAWATAYHFNQNQKPQDCAVHGDRNLALFIINNGLFYTTYDTISNNINTYQQINFTENQTGVWALIYQGFSDKLSKSYVFQQFQGSNPSELRWNNIKHRESNVYHLWVGQSFTYKNFPGRINNLRLCGGLGCYREQGFDVDWQNSPANVVYPKQEFNIVDKKEWDYSLQATPQYQKFTNQFNDVLEFSITAWIRIAPGVARPAWATVYHFNQNEKPQDCAVHGDRTLALFIINNGLFYTTNDFISNNINYYQQINFEETQTGKWALIYQGFSDKLSKSFVFQQFQGANANTLVWNNIKHRESNIYHLWVGQSFTYKNFPGKINNLRLCGGQGCYREQGFDVDWKSSPANIVIPQKVIKVVDNGVFDYSGEASPQFQRYDDQFDDVLEFSITAWIKIAVGVPRPAWATVYHFNQNVKPQDCAVHGDRNLALFIINNGLFYTTYNVQNNNINHYQQINFEENQTGKWALIYQAFTDKLNKGYAFQQFQGSNPSTLTWANVIHRESNIYHLWVGQSFNYKNFPGKINNLRLCGGDGCYREKGFEVDWNSSPVNVVAPAKVINVVNDVLLDYSAAPNTQYQKYNNQFDDVLEFSITAWIRISPGVARPAWATVYHFNQNEKPQDCAVHGDRNLALFIINNGLFYTTYNVQNNNINQYQQINFEEIQTGKWALIYQAFTDRQNKGYAYQQFFGSNPNTLTWANVIHRASNVYHLWVGQSFAYKNFPGRIYNLRLCGGLGCYRESGFDVDWKSSPANIAVPQQVVNVVNAVTLDYNGANNTQYQKFSNQFNDVLEFSITAWIKIAVGVPRPAWATVYHFNQNEKPQDCAVHGDRNLALFIINNGLFYTTYNTLNNNINHYQQINFEENQTGKWALIYQAFTDRINKSYVFQQFQGSNPSTLTWANVIHRESNIYHLWVGQSFNYKNFPGKINNLRLCGGDGCYREKGFEVDWNSPPVDVVVPAKVVKVVDDVVFDYTAPANHQYQKFENQFNDVLEFSITAWIRIAPGVARPAWATVYHFNQNEKPQDCAVHGDRNLALFIINNGLFYTTYNVQNNNINQYQQINFVENQTGVWALVYQAFTDRLNKGYVYQQFNGSNPNTLTWANVIHRASNVYHLWVGQSFAYKNFPGRINNLRLCGGNGCYREQGFDQDWNNNNLPNLKSIGVVKSNQLEQKKLKKQKNLKRVQQN